MVSQPITTVYTRNGDSGDTFVSTVRFPKYHTCLHFIGSIDEAMASIGLAIESSRVETIVKDLEYVYGILSKIASSLQTSWCPDENFITEVERMIDEAPKPKTFIPNYVKNPRYGGVAPIALARTVIRRAERWFWHCFHDTGLGCRNIGVLLNRLSDLVFIIQYQALLLESST
jgi:ATP:cob(I)alamin adenosyltransferase